MPLVFSSRKSQKVDWDIRTPEGFGQIHCLYAKKLLRIAHNQLRDKTEAENIVQDVFCRLWERKDELQIDGPIKNYLIRAVRLAIFSHIRKTIGREQLDKQIYRNVPEYENSVEVDTRFNELVEKTNSLIAQLPPRRQQIYRLSNEEAMSNQEIASLLVISKKTVDSQLTKALKFLRRNLQQHF
ncbi:MAG: RNA polymerase sigma-70 factor [Bacteroidota bacterium]